MATGLEYLWDGADYYWRQLKGHEGPHLDASDFNAKGFAANITVWAICLARAYARSAA